MAPKLKKKLDGDYVRRKDDGRFSNADLGPGGWSGCVRQQQPDENAENPKKTNQPPIDGAAPETETGRLTSVQRRAR